MEDWDDKTSHCMSWWKLDDWNDKTNLSAWVDGSLISKMIKQVSAQIDGSLLFNE